MAVGFLTVPALLFFPMQVCALAATICGLGDALLPSWMGFTAFGVGLAAFLCSVPALVTLCRSDIVSGVLRFLLIAVHALWFFLGGLLLLAWLTSKIVFPLTQKWVG